MRLSRFALAALFSLGALNAAHAQEIIVGAAASLTNAFKAVGEQYEAEHPGSKVTFTFGASDVVLQQILNGAPVDVFASADQKAMDKAVEAKAADAASRKDFVRNEVVLIAPKDAKVRVQSVADLKKAEVTRIAIGHPASVPVGRYTQAGLQQAGEWSALEPKLIPAQNVRQALDYIVRGEVDAGFVFGTDAAVAADKVVTVQSLATPQAVLYPIALTTRAGRSEQAQAFLDYVLSEKGQAVLATFGFQQP